MELDELLSIIGVSLFFIDFVLALTYFTSRWEFSDLAGKIIVIFLIASVIIGIVLLSIGGILKRYKCDSCQKYSTALQSSYCPQCYSEHQKFINSIKNDTYHSNNYGTSNTKCAHYGCNNYIASSGDTNCCTVHSRKCGECGKYIDEDALYCIDCMKNALGN